jgi:LAS superfamily LD-carboxypeptidase LdcB
MSKYHAKSVGGPVCVTDSYRSYAAQVDVYHRKPGLAAVPGTSEHGWGLAVDLCGGVQTYGTPAFNWMKANAPRFGFHHPAWAEPSGSRPEAWHWEFTPPSQG